MHDLVFINNSNETFSPEYSGAISTCIHKCCVAARSDGLNPLVISRPCEAPPYDDIDLWLVRYPYRKWKTPKGVVLRLHKYAFRYRAVGVGLFARRIISRLKQGGLHAATLVVSNDPEMAVMLRSSLPRARVVHWFHANEIANPPYRRRFGQAVHGIAAVSRYTGQWVENYYGLAEGRATTVYNGVDLSQFRPVAARPPADPLTISFMGRIVAEKAPDTLLQAAIIAARRGLRCRLVMMGSDRFEPWYVQGLKAPTAELASLGVPVEWPGYIGRGKVHEALSRVHIHVVPSRWDEPFGLSTLEAMACGVPTVATRTGGTPEVLGDAGLLFDRDNPEQLARHLLTLAADPAQRQRLGEAGRRRAEQFSWQRTWQNLHAVVAAAAATTA